MICAPEYNGSIPPILSNFIAWLSISGADFRNFFNGQIGKFELASGQMVASAETEVERSVAGIAEF